MKHGDEYAAALRRAADKSIRWGLMKSADVRPLPEFGRARDHLPFVGLLLDSDRYSDSLRIRLSCAHAHSLLFKTLQMQGAHCVLTIGDVLVDGVPEFNTSYQRLKQEVRGAYTSTDKPIQFHVWLTFPDLHIIDATFYVYKYHEKLPEPWRWSDFVICSDHPFADRLNIQYVPMLIGDSDLVDSMIYY